MLVAGAIGGCGSSDKSSGLPDNAHKDFVAGCTNGGQPQAGCECLFTELTKTQGIDTEAELNKLNEQTQAAAKSANPAAAVPDSLRKAALACKDKLQANGG